jgi:phage terminase Nu1 subunit (DNA packaging protein)
MTMEYDADYLELIGSPPPKRGRPSKPAEHKPRNRSATTDPEYLAAKIKLANEQAEKIAVQNAAARRALLPAKAVEAEWSSILREVRAGMLALPSRLQQRLPHLSLHDVATIDREIRDALSVTASSQENDNVENDG